MNVTFENPSLFQYYTIIASGENNEEEMILPLDTASQGSEIGERFQGKTIGHLDKPDLIEQKKSSCNLLKLNPLPIGELSSFSNELNLHIAHRKGVKSCTKHHLSNFVICNKTHVE